MAVSPFPLRPSRNSQCTPSSSSSIVVVIDDDAKMPMADNHKTATKYSSSFSTPFSTSKVSPENRPNHRPNVMKTEMYKNTKNARNNNKRTLLADIICDVDDDDEGEEEQRNSTVNTHNFEQINENKQRGNPFRICAENDFFDLSCKSHSPPSGELHFYDYPNDVRISNSSSFSFYSSSSASSDPSYSSSSFLSSSTLSSSCLASSVLSSSLSSCPSFSSPSASAFEVSSLLSSSLFNEVLQRHLDCCDSLESICLLDIQSQLEEIFELSENSLLSYSSLLAKKITDCFKIRSLSAAPDLADSPLILSTAMSTSFVSNPITVSATTTTPNTAISFGHNFTHISTPSRSTPPTLLNSSTTDITSIPSASIPIPSFQYSSNSHPSMCTTPSDSTTLLSWPFSFSSSSSQPPSSAEASVLLTSRPLLSLSSFSQTSVSSSSVSSSSLSLPRRRSVPPLLPFPSNPSRLPRVYDTTSSVDPFFSHPHPPSLDETPLHDDIRSASCCNAPKKLQTIDIFSTDETNSSFSRKATSATSSALITAEKETFSSLAAASSTTISYFYASAAAAVSPPSSQKSHQLGDRMMKPISPVQKKCPARIPPFFQEIISPTSLLDRIPNQKNANALTTLTSTSTATLNATANNIAATTNTTTANAAVATTSDSTTSSSSSSSSSFHWATRAAPRISTAKTVHSKDNTTSFNAATTSAAFCAKKTAVLTSCKDPFFSKDDLLQRSSSPSPIIWTQNPSSLFPVFTHPSTSSVFTHPSSSSSLPFSHMSSSSSLSSKWVSVIDSPPRVMDSYYNHEEYSRNLKKEKQKSKSPFYDLTNSGDVEEVEEEFVGDLIDLCSSKSERKKWKTKTTSKTRKVIEEKQKECCSRKVFFDDRQPKNFDNKLSLPETTEGRFIIL